MDSKQIDELTRILQQNNELWSIIEKVSVLNIPNHYITAGCVAQTVWNYKSGFPLMHGISDIDFIYFDDSDLSYEAEDKVIKKILIEIPCKISIDIKNEARVHIWYSEHFGFDIKPYISAESAIDSFPATATAVGVRLENEKLKVYAPYGLDDLLNMTVRANKVQITEEFYMSKTNKWLSKWSNLKIIPW